MADVRSLLRQQRAARRIVHPHTAYSDAGKLLCTVCHEQVKAESLWDGHTRSPAHLQRVQKLQASRPSADQSSASNKRKHDEDEDMDDVSMEYEDEDGLRKKRSRHDVQGGQDVEADAKDRVQDGATDKATPTRIKPTTPPLPRRISATPSQGVEIQIPSRPATPVAARTDAANGSTGGASRSPLRLQRDISTVAGFASTNGGTAAIATSVVETTTLPPPRTDDAASAAPGAKNGQDIDEDEWAAFEADLLRSNTNGAPARPGIIPAASAEAVISAPVMSADELAAKSAEEERERRRLTADIDLDHEKEDATRALEEEFEDMEELEARVRRLKERREALRQHRGSPPVTDGALGSGEDKRAAAGATDGKENAEEAEESDDDDDEEDDEDADDWAGFRFKG
jgi:zinc finger protein 830